MKLQAGDAGTEDAEEDTFVFRRRSRRSEFVGGVYDDVLCRRMGVRHQNYQVLIMKISFNDLLSMTAIRLC